MEIQNPAYTSCFLISKDLIRKNGIQEYEFHFFNQIGGGTIQDSTRQYKMDLTLFYKKSVAKFF